MKKILSVILYTALALGANPASADIAGTILALRDGDMKKLVVHDGGKSTSAAEFDLEDGKGKTSLAEWQGKYVLVNFWATWCAPCRKEMPQLNALQKEFGGDHFEVLTIATGRNSPEGIVAFFAEAGVDSLPRHQDPKQALASQMGIFGLPISVLLDPKGREIARLRGDADWHSDSARQIIKALVDSEKG
ncbi:MAG: TlpA disulfide reductase family protein [Sulfitobacter sp.]